MTTRKPLKSTIILNKKKPTTNTKTLSAYTQNTFSQNNGSQEFQNITPLFDKEYIPSYIVNEHDLSNNETFNLHSILNSISQYIRVPLNSNTFLGLLYRIIINGHNLPAFKPEDIARLKRKTFSCMLTYINFVTLCTIAIKTPSDKPSFNSHALLAEVYGLFALGNENLFVCDYTLRQPYDDVTALFLSKSFKMFSNFQGQLFKHISLLQTKHSLHVNNLIANISSSTMTFSIFKGLLLNSGPITLHVDTSRVPLKFFATDLDTFLYVKIFQMMFFLTIIYN
jgi:tellurite resistance-related uncharacterized protein